MFLGTAAAQRLRCCVTNRKVAGSIPAGISGFFIDIKSFWSHYVPGVDSASNINEYMEHFLGGECGRCVRLTTYHHPGVLSRNLGTLTSWNPLGLSRPVMGLLYRYRLTFMFLHRRIGNFGWGTYTQTYTNVLSYQIYRNSRDVDITKFHITSQWLCKIYCFFFAVKWILIFVDDILLPFYGLSSLNSDTDLTILNKYIHRSIIYIYIYLFIYIS